MNFGLKQSSSRFFFGSHPSIHLVFLYPASVFLSAGHTHTRKNTSKSPESENARVCVYLCALLSYYYYYYYIQPCERQRLEKESGVHLRGLLTLFSFRNDQDRKENRHGKKKYHLHLISFSLSPLDRKLTFSCVLCQVFFFLRFFFRARMISDGVPLKVIFDESHKLSVCAST